ncbi:hypothetical protein [Ancylobacter sp.]|uniref:hypothetical protein n=1 Tax=Ancylobacter sp. TaxID=1872567 RepID=UPI003D0BB23B
MSHLVLTICLLANPGACREERVATQARAALPLECTAAMAEWATQHPAWRVMKWRCGLIEHDI